MEYIIKLMNQTAIKPRDSDKKEQINNAMLGDLESGLKSIASSGKTNIARL